MNYACDVCWCKPCECAERDAARDRDAARLALFDEMREALRLQVQNYWQTPEDNARFRALLAKIDALETKPKEQI